MAAANDGFFQSDQNVGPANSSVPSAFVESDQNIGPANSSVPSAFVEVDQGSIYANPKYLTAQIDVHVSTSALGVDVPGRNQFNPPTTDGRKFNVQIAFNAIMTKKVQPGPLPAGMDYIKRISKTWPVPVLDSRGRPTSWLPTATVIEKWGYIQIMFNNIDVTFFRGVATQVRNMVEGEPFGSLALDLEFPQISPLEFIPDWMQNFSNVEVWKVDGLSNDRVGDQPMWEGMYVETADASDETRTGLTAICIGSMLQGDNYLIQPAVTPEVVDVGHRICHEINRLVTHYAFRVGNIERVTTGILGHNRGSWNPAVTGYLQDLLAIATVDAPVDVQRTQWTIHMDPGRRPMLRVKDRTTVNWTVTNGSEGVVVQLTRDQLEAPTTIYGEGTAEDNCHWRNTRYPNNRLEPAPVFPGTLLSVGSTHPSVLTWKGEMKHRGWPVTTYATRGNANDNLQYGLPTPTYTTNDAEQCRRFQRANGIAVDGIVGPQTWAATYFTAGNGDDLKGAYFAPLAWDVALEPFIYDAYGGQIGKNPAFDPYQVPYRIRIERHESYGENTNMAQGVLYARDALGRDYPSQWFGQIILKLDPEQGSRFDIKAKHNIMVKQHHGVNRLLHIAGVSIDMQELEVTLTVDERARDLMTIHEIVKRNKEITDPSRRPKDYRRRSRQIEDRITTWDCEAGGGRIPYHAIYRKLWSVVRVPVAEYGAIVRSEFQLTIPSRFAVGIFEQPVTHSRLSQTGDPLNESENYWDQYSDNDGLIIAFGSEGQMGGFYPKAESDDPIPPMTGTIRDDASWNYATVHKPWLWVAIWAESPTINHVSGRLYPAVTPE